MATMVKECSNTATVYKPHGYDYKGYEVECGTYWGGEKILCDDCCNVYEEMYPQGWQYVPGDVCRHGTYVGGDRDCACFACEDAEEDADEVTAIEAENASDERYGSQFK